MNIEKIRCLGDNVLLQFAATANAHEEQLSPGGIVLPRFAAQPKQGEAIEAIVVKIGPGRYSDEFLDHERGTATIGSKHFIPLSMLLPDVQPGTRVLCNAQALAADRIYSDDRSEYRMCRSGCIEAVIEDD